MAEQEKEDPPSEESPAAISDATFPDRRGRIKGMGIFQIILGSLCGLMTLLLIPLLLMQHFVASKMDMPENNAFSMLFSIGTYALLSASFIWVGVAAVKTRRWVPKVVLAINWPLLVLGAVALIPVGWIIPKFMEMSLAANGAAGSARMMAGSIVTMVTVFVILMLIIVYIVIPGLHVLLFRGEAVQRTCDRYDPKPRWTDNLSTSVVGLTIWLGASGLSWFGMGAMGYGAWFGYVPTGFMAAVLGCAAAAASFVLAVQVPKRTPAIWWGVVAFFALMFGGGFSTFLQMDLVEFYRKTGMIPEAQIQLMGAFVGPITTFTRISIAALGAGTLGFLIYVKKYFNLT